MARISEKSKFVSAVAILAIVAAARVASTYRVFNATADEPSHIAAGVEIYQEHHYRLGLENPPLARAAVGVFPYLNGLRVTSPPPPGKILGLDLGSNEDYWTNLALARAGTLLFLPILVFVVYRWAAELHGRIAGLAAVALVTFSPNVLAHAGLATIDFAAAATLCAAAYALRRWAADPRPKNCVVAAVMSAVAVGTKFSALGLVPLFGGVSFLAFRGRRLLGRSAWSRDNLLWAGRSAALYAVTFASVIWAIYGFEVRAIRDASLRPYPRIDRIFAPGDALNRVAYGIVEAPIPALGFFEGVGKLSSILESGHTRSTHGEYFQFLLGELDSGQGWWYYFPVALAVKTTLPFLLILFLAALLAVRAGLTEMDPSEVCVAAFMALVLLASMFSSINIGIRHVLAIYPFAAIFSARVFARSSSLWRHSRLTVVAGAALVLAHGAESAWAHPDYLAYFNESARGREHFFLADSNLDWGQDVARLARYAAGHRIHSLHTALISPGTPDAFGPVEAIPFAAEERPTGWVAVSVSYLQGLRNTGAGDYKWLLAREPKARIGSSIWLYYIEPLEKAPDARKHAPGIIAHAYAGLKSLTAERRNRP